MGNAINWHDRETSHAWIVKTCMGEDFAEAITDELNLVSEQIQQLEQELERIGPLISGRGANTTIARQSTRQIAANLRFQLSEHQERLRNLDTHVIFVVDCDIHYDYTENELVVPR